MAFHVVLLFCHTIPQPFGYGSSSLSFPSNVCLPDNFIDMSTTPFNLSSLFVPFAGRRLADSHDSGFSSAESYARRLKHYYSVNPVREEFKRKENFCNLCKKNIAKERQRCQGPSRHVQQFHMDLPRFFCPLCEFTSNYDKGQIRNHMNRHHGRPPLEGEIPETTDPGYVERFKEMRALCFGDSEKNSEFTRKYDKNPNTTNKKRMHRGLEGGIRSNTGPTSAAKFKEMLTRCFDASEENSDSIRNNDKSQNTTNMKWMHKGPEGEISVNTEPTNAENFKEIQIRCFGASDGNSDPTRHYDKSHNTTNRIWMHKGLEGETRVNTGPLRAEKFKEMPIRWFDASYENSDPTGNYDKSHNTTNMIWMRKGLGGESRVNTEATNAEMFKEMPTRCFGASDEIRKVQVGASTSLKRPLPFSVESILAMPQFKVSPPVALPFTLFSSEYLYNYLLSSTRQVWK